MYLKENGSEHVDWINMDHVREGYELLKIWE
jgi:hypothetical protein